MKKSSDINSIRVGRQPITTSRYSTPARGEVPCCEAPCPPEHGHDVSIKSARERLLPDGQVTDLAELFALLSNETRLRIVMALRARPLVPVPELCVCDLADLIAASASMTSHQLRLLREAGIVSQRRDGKLMKYCLSPGPIAHLLEDGLTYVAR